uniref:Small ribosomal subunit protein uS3 C-terminal domain-containing protein n=1 Tax=Oryza punctata TaxID=4537 RepID=A0A0E0LJ99_ORYPU
MNCLWREIIPLKRRNKSRPGKDKGRWWVFGKVGPIGCLHSSDGTEEERNEVRGQGKRVESIDWEKQNEIRIRPRKMQYYGYHDRSPSRKKNFSKSLWVSGAFKHLKYAGVVNDIAFLIENDGPMKSSTSEKKCLARAKKRLIHFIRQANDLHFAGTTKTTISLFPFFGATFFFQGMGLGIGKLIKGIEMMIEIILRKRIIPYGHNSYLNEVQKMRSFLSNRTNTNTLIESVKIKSVYQSASLIAQDISSQLGNNPISFRSIFSQIVKDIPLIMPKGVEGIRICCSGRLGGAEIARTECGKYGKTSCNVFNQKIDYALAEVSTRNGILGVKVRTSYSQNKKGRVANRMVHNFVLEDMAPKVVDLVVFHIEPLKQRVGLQSGNSIVL